nr:DUF692 domain-containing protein [uncultured Undibacterium sp.]
MSFEKQIFGTGIGLRTRHYRDFLDSSIEIDWLEVHSENYFGEGGLDLFVLDRLAQRYPISLHGVGLGLGSVNDAQERHLLKLKRLVDRVEPSLVSEHLCWNSIAGQYLNDLLPLTFSNQTLNLIADRIDLMQNFLQRQILIENVSTYLRFRDDVMSEAEFLISLSQKTGCGILLDVNNLYVNQCNHQEDALQAIALFAQLPANIIGEVHLAGHTKLEHCLIDDHGSCVTDEVWGLYQRLCQSVDNAIPTLIEWDTDVPELSTLLAEAIKVDTMRDTNELTYER